MNNKIGDKFWYDDIMVLVNKERLLNFIPNKNNSIEENLNSSVRFIIYLSLFLICYSKNFNYVILIILAFITTYIAYTEIYNKVIENFNAVSTVAPTPDNPTGNVLQSDYQNVDRKLDNLLKDHALQNKIKKSLDHKLYRDESDIFDSMHSQRTFYTMPVTTIPNKQKDFAEFLYKMPTTCKEGNGEKCINNLYTPHRQSILDNSSDIITKTIIPFTLNKTWKQKLSRAKARERAIEKALPRQNN